MCLLNENGAQGVNIAYVLCIAYLHTSLNRISHNFFLKIMTNMHINLDNHSTQWRRQSRKNMAKKARKTVWNGAIGKCLLTCIVLGQTLFNPNNIDFM